MAKRILVVEDEVLIALELECLLEDLGHVSVGVAGSSADAIALGRTALPDVALVDIHLIDGPTGVEVARQYAAVADEALQALWRVTTEVLYPAPNPTDADRLALLAVGGYGRAGFDWP